MFLHIVNTVNMHYIYDQKSLLIKIITELIRKNHPRQQEIIMTNILLRARDALCLVFVLFFGNWECQIFVPWSEIDLNPWSLPSIAPPRARWIQGLTCACFRLPRAHGKFPLWIPINVLLLPKTSHSLLLPSVENSVSMQARERGKRKKKLNTTGYWLSTKTDYKNPFLKVLIDFFTGVENEEEVPQAIIHGDTDVKFYRVFPWGDDSMLIRLFSHFTDGGAKFLRNFMKEKKKSWYPSQNQKSFLAHKRFVDFKRFFKKSTAIYLHSLSGLGFQIKHSMSCKMWISDK